MTNPRLRDIASGTALDVVNDQFLVIRSGTTEFLVPNPGLISALSGDVAAAGPGSAAATIQAGAVTPAKSSASANTHAAGISVGDGSTTIVTGNKGFVQVPFNCTISNWTVTGDQSGSVQFDVKRATYANFPATVSLVGSGNFPLLSSQQKNTAAPSGWTSVTLVAGDILEFDISSVSTVLRVQLLLTLLKT